MQDFRAAAWHASCYSACGHVPCPDLRGVVTWLKAKHSYIQLHYSTSWHIRFMSLKGCVQEAYVTKRRGVGSYLVLRPFLQGQPVGQRVNLEVNRKHCSEAGADARVWRLDCYTRNLIDVKQLVSVNTISHAVVVS